MGIRKARAAAAAAGLGLCLALLTAAPVLAATSGVAGRVVESEELEGLNGVEVCAEAAPPLAPNEACDETEGGGFYEILNLEPGHYRVHFQPVADPRYVPQYYLRTYRIEKARVLELEAGSVKSGVSAALELGGWVTGTVSDRAGNPIGDVDACVFDQALPELGERCAKTGSDGKYEIPELPPGQYKAHFSAAESRSIFPQYFAGAGSSLEAEEFAVEGYNETPNIDARLELGATIEGTVTEAGSGLPLAGIRVCALETGTEAEVRCSSSGADGRYAIYGLHTEAYVVGFSVTHAQGVAAEPEDGFVRQYYEDKSSFADANPIDATVAGVYGDVDAHLVAGPEVFPRSGTATPVPTKPVTTLPAPTAPKLVCRKHFRKKLVKGKRRCVRVHHRHRRSHHVRRGT